MIRFDSVSYTYGTSSGRRKALDDVTFSLGPGEMLAVVGANGSGKSTLARLANGLLLPASGRVLVEGIDTATRSQRVRTLVGIVFQRPDDQIVATTVEDDVAFGPENLGLERDEIRRRVDQALAAVGLTGLEAREPHLLSGGQKQRLALAGALALAPRYLVLDEPTSMIDPKGRGEVMRVVSRLREDGHGVMLITHDLEEALVADRVLVLQSGRAVFDGRPSEMTKALDLDAVGLELPSIVRMAESLAAAGLVVDGMSETAVIEALCRSTL